MIVSNVSNPFFVDVFRGLDAAARERHYDVLVEHTDYKVPQLLESVRTMLGKRVAGLALIVSEMAPEVIAEIQSSELPTVVYDVGAPGPKRSRACASGTKPACSGWCTTSIRLDTGAWPSSAIMPG